MPGWGLVLTRLESCVTIVTMGTGPRALAAGLLATIGAGAAPPSVLTVTPLGNSYCTAFDVYDFRT